MYDSSALASLRDLQPIGIEPALQAPIAAYRAAIIEALDNPKPHPYGINPRTVNPVRRNRYLAQSHYSVQQARSVVHAAVAKIVEQRWEDWGYAIRPHEREVAQYKSRISPVAQAKADIALAAHLEKVVIGQEPDSSADLGVCLIDPVLIVESSAPLRDRFRTISMSGFQKVGTSLCTAIALDEFEVRGPVRIGLTSSDRRIKNFERRTIEDFAPTTVIGTAVQGRTVFDIEHGRHRVLSHILCGAPGIAAHTKFLDRKNPEDEHAMAVISKGKLDLPKPTPPFSTIEPMILGLDLFR